MSQFKLICNLIPTFNYMDIRLWGGKTQPSCWENNSMPRVWILDNEHSQPCSSSKVCAYRTKIFHIQTVNIKELRQVMGVPYQGLPVFHDFLLKCEHISLVICLWMRYLFFGIFYKNLSTIPPHLPPPLENNYSFSGSFFAHWVVNNIFFWLYFGFTKKIYL